MLEEYFEEVDWMVEVEHILVVVDNRLVEVEDNFVVEDFGWDMDHHWVEHHIDLGDFGEDHQVQGDRAQRQHLVGLKEHLEEGFHILKQ